MVGKNPFEISNWVWFVDVEIINYCGNVSNFN